MSITAKELANLLHLSEAAISMALNNKPGVSTQTRKKVIETAKKKGFDFSKLKTTDDFMSTSGNIHFIIYKKNGAVVDDTPFFSQLSEGIENGCKASHYYLNVSYLYEEDNIDLRLSKMLSLGCKGIILLGTEMQENDFLPFLQLHIPIVVLDTFFENINTNCVLIDNLQGAYKATNYLIQKCRKQPGYLKSAYSISNFNERSQGFYKAVRHNGMSTSQSVVHHLCPSVEGAYGDMKTLLLQNETPSSSYFADNDLIAAGAIRAFKEFGYRVPEDISIIGFDNMPLCAYIDPALTTVNVPKQYMGLLAAKRISELIVNKDEPPVKIQVATNLIFRKSILLN